MKLIEARMKYMKGVKNVCGTFCPYMLQLETKQKSMVCCKETEGDCRKCWDREIDNRVLHCLKDGVSTRELLRRTAGL